MQINRLTIKQFKKMDDYTVHPQKFNVMIGPNGSGKTTLLDALKCGINGRTPIDHVQAGAAGATLSMDVEGIGTIDRKWAGGKCTSRLNGKTTSQKSIMEMISSQYGFSSTTTNIMSSAEVLQSLFGQDFSQYILGFLDNDMDFDKLIALCEASPEAAEELSMQLPPAPEVISLKDIDEAHLYYKEVVSVVKGELSALQQRANYEGAVPTRSVDEIEAEIQNVSRRIGALSAEMKNYETLKRTHDQNRQQVEILRKKIASITAKNPTPREIAAADDLVSVLRDTVTQNRAEAGKWDAEEHRLADVLARLDEPICPISKDLVCTTDKTGVQAEIQHGRDIAAANKLNCTEKATEAQKKLSDAESKRSELTKAAADYKMKVTLKEELEAAEKVSVTLPPMPDGTLLSRLNDQIAELKKENLLAQRYKDAADARGRAEATEKRLAIYKELSDLLSPKGGARRKVLEHNLEPLQLYCNERMKKLLPKYTMCLDVSEGFRVNMADAAGNLISYEALSNGEKIRILFVLTDMLNALNNFRILMLDNLDGLDEEAMNNLVQVVQDEAESYDHIFLAAVNTTEAQRALSALPAAETLFLTM